MTDSFIPLRSTCGRLIVIATVLGSGTVFLEGTVVNVALPSIANSLDIGVAGLQWVLDSYLLTLSALILLGGTLGDVYGRGRVFLFGSIGFAIASLLVAAAPNFGVLIGMRALQGAAGALLVPNSLALLETVFAEHERGRAIGQWAGWSGASTALGPLFGGGLLELTSWRAIFLAVAPFALAAAWLAARNVPRKQARSAQSVDYVGGVFATLGLAGVITLLISGPVAGFGAPWVLASGIAGVLLLIGFVAYEARASAPLLPLKLFRSREFNATNLATLFLYAALNALFFVLMLQLQNGLGLSPLWAGTALLPINFLLIILSPLSGALAGRIGPRWPMTIGALLAGVGTLLFTRVHPGAGYLTTILPAVVLFGLGLGLFVAPLTAAVLSAAPQQLKGTASAFNNAVARLAGLVAVALVPLASGMAGMQHIGGQILFRGFVRSMYIATGMCVAGGLVAAVFLDRRAVYDE